MISQRKSSDEDLIQKGIIVKNLEPFENKLPININSLLANLKKLSTDKIIQFLNSQIIGRNILYESPFGLKIKVYLDYTASGQELYFINQLIQKHCELYANVHTEISYTGVYMSNIFHQAEIKILQCCNANPQEYFVTSVGSGATAGVEYLQKFLGIYVPSAQEILQGKLSTIKNKLREKGKLPLVIITSYEHHSNEVTWRYQLCDVLKVEMDKEGFMDLDSLEQILQNESTSRKQIWGSFSAGSNVTGIQTEIEKVAMLLKKYNGLVFFDYAGVGPYIPIDLSKTYNKTKCLIDGIFLSPHKFLGGPGSCGLLIMSKSCYHSELPPSHGYFFQLFIIKELRGGGTVDFVSPLKERFSKDPESREKSGTPGIIQTIKSALVFELKYILQDQIIEREELFNKLFFEEFGNSIKLLIVGPKQYKRRVPIVSFIIRHHDRFLHANFTSQLLSDLFGIQSRSGCFCAGPYGHILLDIDQLTSELYQDIVSDHPEVGDNYLCSGFKPGWSRINLHWTLTMKDFNYIIKALNFISNYGYIFLRLYNYEFQSGKWIHIEKNSIEQNNSNATSTTSINNCKSMYKSPILGIQEGFQEKFYAKNEESREILYENHLNNANLVLQSLIEQDLQQNFQSEKLDPIPEFGKLVWFYTFKGHIKDRYIIDIKVKSLQALSVIKKTIYSKKNIYLEHQIQYYQKLKEDEMKADPNSPAHLQAICKCLQLEIMTSGNLNEICKLLNEAYSIKNLRNPDLCILAYQVSSKLLQLREYTKATYYCENILKCKTNFLFAYILMSKIHLFQEQFEEALENCNYALEKFPSCLEIIYLKLDILERMNDKPQLQQYLNSVKQIQPIDYQIFLENELQAYRIQFQTLELKESQNISLSIQHIHEDKDHYCDLQLPTLKLPQFSITYDQFQKYINKLQQTLKRQKSK